MTANRPGWCPRGTPAAERLAFHSEAAPNGCRLWTGGLAAGYGTLGVNGRRVGAHRLAYELAYGPIPVGLVIDHLCRTPRCINPQHLEAVTTRTNLARGETLWARVQREGRCINGHLRSEHGVRTPRGYWNCRPCMQKAKREYEARQRALRAGRSQQSAAAHPTT